MKDDIRRLSRFLLLILKRTKSMYHLLLEKRRNRRCHFSLLRCLQVRKVKLQQIVYIFRQMFQSLIMRSLELLHKRVRYTDTIQNQLSNLFHCHHQDLDLTLVHLKSPHSPNLLWSHKNFNQAYKLYRRYLQFHPNQSLFSKSQHLYRFTLLNQEYPERHLNRRLIA